MAAELGLDAIRADALATVGTARGDLGDSRGDAELEIAIELAEQANAPQALFRALNNLSWRYTAIDMRRAYELTQRKYETWLTATATCARLVGAHPAGRHRVRARTLGRGARARRGRDRIRRGWQPAVRRALMPPRPRRHQVRARGCQPVDAEIDRSLALAARRPTPRRRAPSPSTPRISACGQAIARVREQLLDSTLATARTSDVGIELIHYEAALLAALLGLDPAELAIPPVEVTDTPRRRATAALLEGDLLGAADALAELGKVNDEAYLRLRAGERLLAEGRAEEGRAQVERALVFFRGVRATRFIAEAEALLADIHRQSA